MTKKEAFFLQKINRLWFCLLIPLFQTDQRELKKIGFLKAIMDIHFF